MISLEIMDGLYYCSLDEEKLLYNLKQCRKYFQL
jgi:hypothetical protein